MIASGYLFWDVLGFGEAISKGESLSEVINFEKRDDEVGI